MGEVFRAFDPRLGRPVAAKRVRGDSNTNTARQRLRREARAAAGLSHPSIVQVHDILQQDGDDWIVMEWIDGPSLRQLICSGPLQTNQVVRLGSDIADGLAAAHGRNVLHRDLKTENVLVTQDGRAKILDFGLAKSLRTDEASSLTEGGRLVGTCRAMSPEQARGFPLDERSDLFALGVLLYELATGISPFRAESITETLIKVCSYAPLSVTSLNAEIPLGLASLIDELIEKHPLRRPSSAVEVGHRLRSWGDDGQKSLSADRRWAGPTGILAERATLPLSGSGISKPKGVPFSEASTDSFTGSYVDGTRFLKTRWKRSKVLVGGVVSIGLVVLWGLASRYPVLEKVAWGAHTTPQVESVEASSHGMGGAVQPSSQPMTRVLVLPFESLGPDKNTFMASGLTEEITHRLVAVGSLAVVSATSARRASENGWTVEEIGQRLDVKFLLEGMVRTTDGAQAGEFLRITLRLVHVEDDQLIWFQDYDRLPSRLVDLQDEIAANVVRHLGVSAERPEAVALARQWTNQPQAYLEYLRGLEAKSESRYQGLRSRRFLYQAIGSFRKAVDADPSFVEAWAELSQAHSHLYLKSDDSQERRRWAREALERATTLDPDRWSVQMARAFFLYRVERDYDGALGAFSRASLQTPHSSEVLEGIGFVRRRQGRLADAAKIWERARSLDQANPFLIEELGRLYMDLRLYAEADVRLAEALSLEPTRIRARGLRALNHLSWKGCPEPLDPSRPCTTEASWILLGNAVDTFDPVNYSTFLDLSLIDAARLPHSAAEPILQRARRRMAIRREGLVLEFVSPWLYYREIQLLKLSGLDDQARQDLHALSRYLEAELGMPDARNGAQAERNHALWRIANMAFLGLAYADLGRFDDALEMGQLAVSLAADDAYSGPEFRKFLAVIYAKGGQRDRAIDLLEELLPVSSKHVLSRTQLALDPLFEDLWEEPRFQALVRPPDRDGISTQG